VIRFAAIALLVTASTALGASSVFLEPVGGQDLRQAFRTAKFSAQNGTGQIVRAIRFRSRDGGPTIVVVDALIAPGAAGEGEVPLPALSPRQSYDVALLDSPDAARERSKGVLESLQADIAWPNEMVNADRFLNWRYDQAPYDPVAWPAALKRNIFLVLVLGCLAMAAIGLTRSRAAGATDESPPAKAGLWRWFAMGAIVAATTLAAGWLLGREDLVESQSTYMSSGEQARPLMAVGSRRTAVAYFSSKVVPLYVTKDQMESDTTVIYVGHYAEAPTAILRPGGVRLFEQVETAPQFLPPGGENPSPSPSSFPSSSSLPSSGPPS
jgi:hypothetical protein